MGEENGCFNSQTDIRSKHCVSGITYFEYCVLEDKKEIDK